MKFTKLTIILCFVLTTVLSFYIMATNLTNKESSTVNKKETVHDLYSASLTLCQIHKKCGHTVTAPSSGTISYSSAEELTKRFPGYEITSGEGENLVMSATLDSFCPEHYIATLSGKKISVIRLCNNEEVATFKINSQILSENEKSLLEQGLTLDSKKALTSFIEDFTS